MTNLIVTDCTSEEGNAIGFVRPSVCPSVHCILWNYWPLTLTFCVSHHHNSPGIGSKRRRSSLKVKGQNAVGWTSNKGSSSLWHTCVACQLAAKWTDVRNCGAKFYPTVMLEICTLHWPFIVWLHGYGSIIRALMKCLPGETYRSLLGLFYTVDRKKRGSTFDIITLEKHTRFL